MSIASKVKVIGLYKANSKDKYGKPSYTKEREIYGSLYNYNAYSSTKNTVLLTDITHTLITNEKGITSKDYKVEVANAFYTIQTVIEGERFTQLFLKASE